MKIVKYQDVESSEEVPGAIKHEVITEEDGAPNFAMRVFEVEPGGSSPFHSHSWEHEVFILSGQGVVQGQQGETKIEKDNVVFVAPDEKHSFVNKGDEPLRFVCVIPHVH